MEQPEQQNNNQVTQGQPEQAGYDYSQPLFERKQVSMLSFISAIIFVVAGVIEIFTTATRYPIEVGAVLMAIGIIIMIRNILAMRGITLFGMVS